MAVIQEAFDIPDDIAIGLATGLYRRFGGVVRYAMGENKGQIVKHLKPIDLPKDSEAALSVVEKAIKFGKEHKKLMVGAMIVASVAAASGGIYTGVTKHRQSKFQKAFRKYIGSIREGNLDVETIEELEKALSNVKSVNLKGAEMALLLKHIRDYTENLADINNVDIDIRETNADIIDLRKYLELQKKILGVS